MDQDTDWDKIPVSKGTHRVNVVGILQSSNDNNYRFDKDYTIYMDINYALKLQKEYRKANKIRVSADDSNYNQIYVKANSLDDVTAIEAAIKDMGLAPIRSTPCVRKPRSSSRPFR
jgi:hypothetical protein